jgi:hypothetical protein
MVVCPGTLARCSCVSRDVDDRVRHSKGCAGEVVSCKAACRRGVKIFCELVGGTHHDYGVLANIEDEVIAVGGMQNRERSQN